MNTYTITQTLIDLLLGVLDRAGTTDDGEYKWDTLSKAKKLLQSIAPNGGDAEAAPSTSPLNDEIMWKLWNAQGVDEMNQPEAIAFGRAVEAAHGIALPPPAK